MESLTLDGRQTIILAVLVLSGGTVVFRSMGANYDAAVMSSGQVGLALGATPNAIVIQLYIGWFA